MKLTPKVSKRLNVIVQITVTLAALIFIYYRFPGFFEKDNFNKTITSIVSAKKFLPLIILTVALMPINWLLEAIKWRHIISKTEKLSLRVSIKAVLGGITVSMITPNRTGEYLGRVFVLKSPFKGILLTLAGSFSQLIITFILGCISLVVAMPVILNYFGIEKEYMALTIRLALIFFFSAALIMYFYFPLIYKVAEMPFFKRFKKLSKYSELSQVFSKIDLLIILAISLMRYLIFTTQYYILLLIAGIDINPANAFLLISLQYFVMAFIPSIALSEIGIRGSVAILIFSVYFRYYSVAPFDDVLALSVAFASVTLWIINLAVPALAGIPVILRTKFFKE